MKSGINHIKFVIVIIFIAMFLEPLRGQAEYLYYSNDGERNIFLQIQNNKHLNFEILNYLLIAEGNASHLEDNEKWFNSIKKEATNQIDKELSILEKGEKLYEFLQERVLRKYSTTATEYSLITSGEFNCVTASALYYELGSALGISVLFYSTPFHVCPIIETENKKVWVEMTDAKDGFDKFQDIEGLVEWLVENKFILPEEIEQKSQEGVYNEFLKGRYQSSPSAILAYHYYNQALKKSDFGNAEDTFWNLAKANFLEDQDEMINLVYDMKFLEVSLRSKLNSRYLNAAKVYFYARVQDTSACTQAIVAIHDGMINQLINDRDFSQADSLIVLIEPISHYSDMAKKTYNEIVQFVTVNKAIEFQRIGKYEDAFILMTTEFNKNPFNAKLQNAYESIGLSYANKRLSVGKYKEATEIIDSLLIKLPDFVRIREMYVVILLSEAMESNTYITNPSKALTILQKAYKIDSTNILVCQSLSATYHELAMAEIRKNNWKNAKKFINDGLKIMPDHEFLKSDLELLKKEQPKP